MDKEQIISDNPNRLRFINHQNIYLFGLFIILIALPTSMFLMSLGQIIIFINWLIERQFVEKFKRLKNNQFAILIISIFFLHLLGLILTSDFKYALVDLRMKAPFLIIPLVIGTSKPISRKTFKILISFFIASVILASFYSVYRLIKFKPDDIRNISIFISHIRFSLLIALSVFLLFYFVFVEKLLNKFRFLLLIPAFWLLFFLVLMESITGIIIVFNVTLILYVLYLGTLKKTALKVFSLMAMLILIFLGANWLYNIYKEVIIVEKIDFKSLQTHTINNNTYTHDTTKRTAENGNLIWIYICEKELQQEWPKRSLYSYWGLDEKKQPINATLIRYLTSKGLRKDSLAIQSLTDEDIHAIENGNTCYKTAAGSDIKDRIKSLLWELQSYIETGNPNNHSAAQRLEFWKAAYGIIKENWLFGVGIGDIYKEYDAQYRKMNSPLDITQRLRTHNQYLSFFIVFGILGLIWFLFVMFYPLWVLRRKNFYYLIFILIAAISMIAEDTLETQAGVTFYVFFSSFFLLVMNSDDFVVPNQAKN